MVICHKQNQKETTSTWIDIVKPTGKDIEKLKKDYDLHPVIADELRSPSPRTRVEAYPHYLYFIYYFPIYDPEEGASTAKEIDFIRTARNTVVTVRYEAFDGVFDGFGSETDDSSLTLTYRLVKQLILFEERQLRHIRRGSGSRRTRSFSKTKSATFWKK